ncbi:Elongation factor 1-beta [Methanocaldococcus lauensis]|uniref:Elongation factor 1-beta n=1 Tax=Methanocaldococcus lauensis TaxID=2546128 RepID=A0A8D6STS6_9EURY|nr:MULTISPECIES: elongation factor 1-beta [Methanocaldococcus]MCQ6253604.1 elongation factor 1-beta [Methanocaldococcus sp.]CAB3287398.1 Elongation factor 1-beta [Methanocaldococcus lauensis]CAB3290084.1 Elongation factor 1-beta [Methanocaldococcus lauensis]
MASVLAKIKIMPKSPEVDKEQLKEKVKKVLETQDVAIRGLFDEPLAFGLYTVYVVIEMEEREGGTEPIENALAEIDDVESVETVEVSLA